MQFLVSVIDDGTGPDTATEDAAIDVFNGRLQTDGNWVFAGGLTEPSQATVVDNRSAGAAEITDGPFLESKEYVAGFWILEAADHDAAVELATQASKACNRKIEVRGVLSA